MTARGSETIEQVRTIMQRMGDCTARQIAENPDCHIGKAAVNDVLCKMKKHSVVIVVGKDLRSPLYRLTGVSPYALCKTCQSGTPIWNLHSGKCSRCQKVNKGTNQQLSSDFAFLKNPAFKLIEQIFRPLEEV